MKLEIGKGQMVDATAVVLLRDRDETLNRMSMHQRTTIHTVFFFLGEDEEVKTFLRFVSEHPDFQSVCVDLVDGSTKYTVNEASHLNAAEKVAGYAYQDVRRAMREAETALYSGETGTISKVMRKFV